MRTCACFRLLLVIAIAVVGPAVGPAKAGRYVPGPAKAGHYVRAGGWLDRLKMMFLGSAFAIGAVALVLLLRWRVHSALLIGVAALAGLAIGGIR